MPISKKIMIARKLFGDSQDDFKDAREKGIETLERFNNRLRLHGVDDAIHQEGAAIRKRRVIKIRREAVDNSTRSPNSL